MLDSSCSTLCVLPYTVSGSATPEPQSVDLPACGGGRGARSVAQSAAARRLRASLEPGAGVQLGLSMDA